MCPAAAEPGSCNAKHLHKRSAEAVLRGRPRREQLPDTKIDFHDKKLAKLQKSSYYNNTMERKTDSLVFKFAVVFLDFTIITLIMTGFMAYVNQTKIYRSQCVDRIKEVGSYFEELMVASGDEFITYQNYYKEHFAEVNIPYDIDNWREPRENYEALFASQYPGKTLGRDIAFAELSPEVQQAWFIYKHVYWLLTFEKARKVYDLPYTYYLYFKQEPGAEEYTVVYMIDGERTEKEGSGGAYMYLGDEYQHTPSSVPVEWRTWSTGQKQPDFQVWDNEWGHTYTYYVPLIINGNKLGVIACEINVARVNQGILRNSLIQIAGMAAILMTCTAILLLFIYRRYISKIIYLKDHVKEYTADKNVELATVIQNNIVGDDELAMLGRQVVVMILELEKYMKSLMETSLRLKTSEQKAAEMNALANKDSLTGIRNKTAYDNEVRKLEWRLADGHTQFGIAMIDLNFLKRINDTYGHDQGNIAIKKLCMMVCAIFKHSPVFRIGGDEFVVILENSDYEHIAQLTVEFNEKIAAMQADDTLEQWERVSAALGYALYDPEIDTSVVNVFKRADKAMYTRKKEMKAVREN